MSTDPAVDRTAERTADRTVDRTAAVVLLAASLAGLLVMALHPTGRDAVRNATTGAPNTLLSAVHLLGMLAQPLLFAGLLALTRRLRAGRRGAVDALAVGATVYFALASVAVVGAAAASGLVAPAVLRDLAGADAPARATILATLHYTGQLNQTLARIGVLCTGVAVLLWSAAMLADGVGRRSGDRERTDPGWSRTLTTYGLLLGVALTLGAGSGHLRLDIHGFGLVVIGQGAWMAGVAARLWRRQDGDGGDARR